MQNAESLTEISWYSSSSYHSPYRVTLDCPQSVFTNIVRPVHSYALVYSAPI
jgi:hypothetical protein